MLTPKRTTVEVAIDSVASAVMAEAAGADRLELCQCLELGGFTPSPGLFEAVRSRVSIPIFVMVRSQGGGFRYDAADVDVMVRDVARVREAGAAGVVVGALTADRLIDVEATRAMVAAAGPLPVTFHRAIDQTVDPVGAIDQLVDLGVRRVLASGGPTTAFEGRAGLAAMVRRSAGRLVVLAGGGVRAEHVVELVRETGVTEVHLSGVMLDDTPEPGYGRPSRPNEARVRGVITALA